MAAWKSLAVWAGLLTWAGFAAAQSYPLAEAPQAGDCFSMTLEMKLAGERKMSGESGPITVKLGASATHAYSERLLAVEKGMPQKAVRWYDKARAVITSNKDSTERTLAEPHRLIVAQRCGGQLVCWCPTGPLVREELETTDHFDTLTLAGLLPGRSVAVNDTWKIGSESAQALCTFEGLISQDLTGKLESVTGDLARISVTGTATGIDLGAQVKLTVKATARYDLKLKRLIGLEWQQKDERAGGPASPATTVETTTTLTRTVLDAAPKELGDGALAEAEVDNSTKPPSDSATLLHLNDAKKRFALGYAREWHVVGESDDHLILRLMDRGDFVAQAIITPWKKSPTGKPMTLDEFEALASEVEGWEPDETLDKTENTGDAGQKIYRLSVLGELDGIADVLQNFYLVATPDGEQVVVSFTLKKTQAEKLGRRDGAFIEGLALPGKTVESDKPKGP